MKVKLSFEDWKDFKTGKSVYNTEKCVDLSMGNFHAGTVFDAEIELSEDDSIELENAIKDGYVPVFHVYVKK